MSYGSGAVLSVCSPTIAAVSSPSVWVSCVKRRPHTLQSCLVTGRTVRQPNSAEGTLAIFVYSSYLLALQPITACAVWLPFYPPICYYQGISRGVAQLVE